MPARASSSARTESWRPAWAAWRRMRCAVIRAMTQQNTWTRIWASVWWCMGLKEITWGVFELAEAELGLGLGPVAGHDLADGPVVAVSDEEPLAEDAVFQGVAGGLVHPAVQADVRRASPVRVQVSTSRTYCLLVILSMAVSSWARERRARPRARVSPIASSSRPALASAWSNPRDWPACSSAEWVSTRTDAPGRVPARSCRGRAGR